MSFNDDVRNELRGLAQAYLENTYSLGDLLQFEVEHCDLTLDIDEDVRSQMTSLALIGEEYVRGWAGLEDFDEIVFRILSREPDSPTAAARRESLVLARAHIERQLSHKVLLDFTRRNPRFKLLPPSWQREWSDIALLATADETDEQACAQLDDRLQRLIDQAAPTVVDAAAD